MRFRPDNTEGLDGVTLAALNAAFYTIIADARTKGHETARNVYEERLADMLLRLCNSSRSQRAPLRLPPQRNQSLQLS